MLLARSLLLRTSQSLKFSLESGLKPLCIGDTRKVENKTNVFLVNRHEVEQLMTERSELLIGQDDSFENCDIIEEEAFDD